MRATGLPRRENAVGADMGEYRGHRAGRERCGLDPRDAIPIEIRTGDVVRPNAGSADRASTAPANDPAYTPYHATAPDSPGALTDLNGRITGGSSWRRLLLGTVAAGSLFFYGGRRAEAGCSVTLPIATCTGNLAGRVNYDNVAGVTTLNVNTLTANIAPAAGTVGINFVNNAGAASLTSNTGAYTITTLGAANGINVSSFAGAVSVNHTGDINANRYAVAATGFGPSVTVQTNGNITSAAYGGIAVVALGTAMVTHSGGDIMANTVAVLVNGISGVTINTTGNITSTLSRGIVAVAGGANATMVTHQGGNILALLRGVYARSYGGQITVETTGNITGTNQHGISSMNTTGDSTVTINSGTVMGATSGVHFVSTAGQTNILNNVGGTITSAGNAVLGYNGDETVNNTGTITGNVDLNVGTDTFNNNVGGTLNSGANLFLGLGAGETVTNSATWRPGGAGTVQTTAVTGNVNQMATGNLVIDVDDNVTMNDKVTVTGTATLAGTVTVNLLNTTPAGGSSITVLTAVGGVVDNGVTLVLPGGVQGFLTVNANDVTVTFGAAAPATIGADLPNLTPTQQTTLASLNAVIAANPAAAQVLITALQNLSPAVLTEALNLLSGQALASLGFSGIQSMLGFSATSFSCKAVAGPYAIVRERECIWLKPEGRWFSQDRTKDNLGFRETAFGITAGAQIAVDKAKRWIVGASFGYERVTTESSAGGSTVRGNRYQGRVVVKYNRGPWLLAAGVGGGYGVFESERRIAFAGFSSTAKGDFSTPFLTGRLRAEYLWHRPMGSANWLGGAWYVKPGIDVDFNWLKRTGFTESGGGGAGLQVQSSSQFSVAVAPSIEVGGEWVTLSGAKLRPFLRLGATIFSNTSTRTTARFAVAPGSPNFTTTSRTDRVYATVAAGISLVRANGFSLRVTYSGSFSRNSRQHSISAKFIFKF